MKKWIYFIFLIFSLAFQGYAQDDGPDETDYFEVSSVTDIQPMHSFIIEIGMPVALSNKFRHTYMDGLIYFSPYYQFTFRSNLAIGAGVFYNYLRIKSTSTYENVYGGNNSVGAFFKVSYEKFHSKRFATDIGAKIGGVQAMYYSNKLKANGVKSSDLGLYIEPNIGFILTVAEKSAFRFFLGYNFLAVPFTNKTIGMETDGGMSGKDFRKYQQNLTIGFGYTFYAKTR